MNDNSRLLVACSQNRVSQVEDLLQSGAVDVNGRFSGDFTALHVAAAKRYIDLCMLLLKYGADPHAKNLAGKTPLQCASKDFRERLTQYLLSSTYQNQLQSVANKTSTSRVVDSGLTSSVQKSAAVLISSSNSTTTAVLNNHNNNNNTSGKQSTLDVGVNTDHSSSATTVQNDNVPDEEKEQIDRKLEEAEMMLRLSTLQCQQLQIENQTNRLKEDHLKDLQNEIGLLTAELETAQRNRYTLKVSEAVKMSQDELVRVKTELKKSLALVKSMIDRPDQCLICMANKKSVLLLPCKHLVSCTECSSNITYECPVCRSEVDEKMEIFV